ncbi:MAG: dethiobiotin synthase [Chlamydiales bacterium]|nr:dethiobiotin synthase [Chlamydiales bacterium]
MHGLIVTGISTDVGKTVVSAVLAKALKADYWKPIEAGGCDTERVSALSGAVCHPPAYRFKTPTSPHHAAFIDKVAIDPQRIVPPQATRLIIEGCGGVMVPYGEDHLGTLFSKWNFPWIVVSKNYLGSINHTLLTLEWLKAHRQQIMGVIFNGEPCPHAEEFILSYGGVAPLGRLLPEKKLDTRRIACYARQLKETLRPSGILSRNEEPTLNLSPS